MYFRKIVFLAFLSLAFTKTPLIAAQPKVLYWICYSDFYKSHSKFLMQIDSSGKIVKSPKLLTLPFEFDSVASALAMSHSGDGNILVWFAGKGGNIFRVFISKQNLNVIEMNKIDLHTGLIQSFATTQKPEENFLALKTTGKGLTAFQMYSSGFPVLFKRPWPISPSAIGDNHQGFAPQQVGVSSDGRVSFWVKTHPEEPKLFVQPLDQNGRIGDTATFITSVFEAGVGAFGGIDISNPLPGKRRFLVYAYAPEERGGSIFDHIYLQVIDSDSGAKIGPRITLYNPQGGYLNSTSQNVAIDPLGKFIVFEDNNLFFLKLDSHGKKNGLLKNLVMDQTISGIDILLEN
jgi:hypothetical protein